MKKFIKFVMYVVLIAVALVVLLVATLPLWLGPVVKPAANIAVPQITQTKFNLGHLYLNPYTGRFEVGEMVLGNPEGYDEPVAVSLSNLVVDVAMNTVHAKYIHVEEVTVDGFFASYVKGGENGVDNFKQIQYNVAGGKEAYELKQAEAEAKKAQDKAAEEAAEKAEAEAEKAKLEKMTAEERKEYERLKEAEEAAAEAAARKLVIDKLVINNIRLKYGLVTIPVPSITLTDIGKESDGASLGDIVDQIWQAILKSALAVGDGAKALANATAEGAKAAASAVGEGAKAAASAVGDGAAAAASAVGDGASAAASAVSDGTSAAVGAVGDGAKAAADAVSDGAGKAVDAVKGLFK